jgi:hypothetical protein
MGLKYCKRYRESQCGQSCVMEGSVLGRKAGADHMEPFSSGEGVRLCPKQNGMIFTAIVRC